MITTFNAVRNALLAWLELITGRTVVLLNDGQLPKPRLPYATLLLTGVDFLGIDSSMLDLTGLVETTSSPMLLRADMNLYGDDAMINAIRLARSLYASSRYFDLYQIMGLGAVVSLQDLSALETGAIKSRALLQVNFYVTIDAKFDSTFIEEQPIILKELTKNYEEEIDGGTNPRQKDASCPIS